MYSEPVPISNKHKSLEISKQWNLLTFLIIEVFTNYFTLVVPANNYLGPVTFAGFQHFRFCFYIFLDYCDKHFF